MAAAPKDTPAAKSLDTQSEGGKGRSKVKLLIGWILVPSLVIGGLFGAGVHVGARHPDMLLTRAVLWMTQAEASRPPATPEEAAPLSRQLYLIALPTKEFGLQVELDAKDLTRLAGTDAPDDLDCKALCARVWNEQHPDKEFVEAKSCSFADEKTKLGALECELEVEKG